MLTQWCRVTATMRKILWIPRRKSGAVAMTTGVNRSRTRPVTKLRTVRFIWRKHTRSYNVLTCWDRQVFYRTGRMILKAPSVPSDSICRSSVAVVEVSEGRIMWENVAMAVEVEVQRGHNVVSRQRSYNIWGRNRDRRGKAGGKREEFDESYDEKGSEKGEFEMLSFL